MGADYSAIGVPIFALFTAEFGVKMLSFVWFLAFTSGLKKGDCRGSVGRRLRGVLSLVLVLIWGSLGVILATVEAGFGWCLGVDFGAWKLVMNGGFALFLGLKNRGVWCRIGAVSGAELVADFGA